MVAVGPSPPSVRCAHRRRVEPVDHARAGASSCRTTSAAPPAFRIGDERVHERRAGGVEIAVGLVEQEHARTRERQARDREPALHAGREPAHALIGNAAERDALERAVESASGDAEHCSGEPRFSRAVRSSYSPGACARKPTCRDRIRCLLMSWPATLAVPAFGRSNVARTRRKVLLPLPFAPTSPTTSPGRTCSDTPRRHQRAPKRRAIPGRPPRGMTLHSLIRRVRLGGIGCETATVAALAPQGPRLTHQVRGSLSPMRESAVRDSLYQCSLFTDKREWP